MILNIFLFLQHLVNFNFEVSFNGVHDIFIRESDILVYILYMY